MKIIISILLSAIFLSANWKSERESLDNVYILGDFRVFYTFNGEHALSLENKVDLIVLAGYLSIIDKDFISNWNNKIINIHPSLLPKYGGKGMYGMNVHEAVIANKEKKSGCTVHFVDVDIDTGKILLQRKVDVSNNETPESLQKKVLKEEHQLLIEAIEKVISDSVISDKGGI